MSDINQLRLTFRSFWLAQMVPVLLQMNLRDVDVTIAQHRAWARWREAAQ